MSERYKQFTEINENVRFSKALFGQTEHSKMSVSPIHLTTFNAGDIVPIYCCEILPDESIELNLDFIIRQTTLLTPTMGHMEVEFLAFWVPNRIVNNSWKAVEGENYSGSWTAPSVSLAPLVRTSTGSIQIPVGSVADYYGFPTQQAIPNSVLSLCHDLKFRGYVMIYNEHFRDQNYQPPIPMSTLNVYQGFLDQPLSSGIPLGLSSDDTLISSLPNSQPTDGSVGAGAIAHDLYGSTGSSIRPLTVPPASNIGRFKAYSKPLKANKLHDYFTSVLPSPQKSLSSVMVPVTGQFSIPQQFVGTTAASELTNQSSPLKWRVVTTGVVPPDGDITSFTGQSTINNSASNPSDNKVFPSNLILPATSVSATGASVDIKDIRMASAIQQYYEILARGGSRYRSILASLFGVEVNDIMVDVPQCLGKAIRPLDLYQTAQTSASEDGSTPQGNLSAFGYTASTANLFSHTFVEHGYLHVFAIVRHRNIYSSMLSRDNFRLTALDFFTPPLANISEQPVYTREINPFSSTPNNAFGYQEAWSEYRYDPDRVSGYMRNGISQSLSLWNYSDTFDSSIVASNGTWLKSNSQEVLDRTLAVTSSLAPQFKAAFKFNITKVLPMPTYSVPGMDII